ncbi:MAG: SDR family oxidoreductase [Acidimicrobiia bacterium]
MAFTGRVALVTGAASGMGRLAAQRLSGPGRSIAAVDVDAEGLASLAAEEPSVTPYECDITDAGAVADVVENVESEHGPVGRLCNIAGIGSGGPILDTPLETFHKVMDVNYFGMVHVCAAVAPLMVERGGGEIVNLASLAGWLPAPGMASYNASKFAAVAYTEVLAREMKPHGIRVLCVCPPQVDTPMLDVFIEEGAVPPKTREMKTTLQPSDVIDGIEPALEAGKLFFFPGRGSTAMYRARRYAPNLTWKAIRRAYDL